MCSLSIVLAKFVWALLGFVKIRLTGDRESVYLAAKRLALRLKWKEYPLFLDNDRTKIDEESSPLCNNSNPTLCVEKCQTGPLPQA
jgi:hypothetical protein